MKEIFIPHWMRRGAPLAAELCEIVNESLRKNPNATLQDFANELNTVNAAASARRLWNIENKQLKEREA